MLQSHKHLHHRSVVGEYDFEFFLKKMVKTIITHYNFKFKLEIMVSNYNFELNFKFFYTYKIMLFHLKYFSLCFK